MKIYEFDWGGDTDWIFAPTLKEAKKFYLQLTGIDDFDDCEISDVQKKKWGSEFIVDLDEYEPDDDEEYDKDEYCDGYKIIESFAEYAERNTGTDIIASTAQ